MTLMPGPTVEELIVTDILNTLTSIIGPPNWNTDVATVLDMKNEVEQHVQPPAILLVHESTENRYRPTKEQKLARYTLYLGVDADSPVLDNPRQEITRFLADVEQALHETHTRGGNAQDTLVRSTEIVPRTTADAIQQATMTVEVVFAHPFGDPLTPQ